MKGFFSKLSFLLPLEGVRATLLRFPLSVLCCLVFFVCSLLDTHKIIDLSGSNILLYAALGYFWFGIVRLLAESRTWAFAKEMLLALPGFAVVIALLHLQGMVFFTFFMPAFLLCITFAAYLKSDSDDSLWVFNKQLWIGWLISNAAGLLWGAGALGALASVKYLFELDISNRIWGDIWLFAASVLTPVYTLSWVAERFEFDEEECKAPPQIHFILDWILTPLVSVYFLIVYAYFVKMALAMELPRGQLSMMIAGFAGMGVLTYVIGWPLREKGAAVFRLFCKWFFPVLILPVAVLFLAIGERISQYGVTEKRYAVVLLGVWLAVLIVLHLLKRLRLKYIMMVLSGFLCLASFGPWGASAVAERSQVSRLKTLLETHQILVDGRIEKNGNLSADVRSDISSIVRYLVNSNHDNQLRTWFPDVYADAGEKKRRYQRQNQIIAAMGFSFTSRHQKNSGIQKYSIDKRTNAYQLSDFAGYERIRLFKTKWSGSILLGQDRQLKDDAILDGLRFNLEGNVLTVLYQENPVQVFDFSSLITFTDNGVLQADDFPTVLDFELDGQRYGLLVGNVIILRRDDDHSSFIQQIYLSAVLQ